jgi:dienelactone hydrolase
MRNVMTMVIFGLLTTLLPIQARAEVKGEEVRYTVGDTELVGYLAYDDAVEGKRPGVLVVHEWWGQNEYARKRATMLAGLGYTAFALDMYGGAKVAEHPQDATKFMQAILGNLPEAEKRFHAAHDLLKKHPTVDAEHTAAIGYCMGGGVVLYMAQAGADLDGVVSFHGSLGVSPATPAETIHARVLVLNGAADPFTPAEAFGEFTRKMAAAKVDFEIKNYAGVVHSFTNPVATETGKKFGMPLAYDEAADKDSWQRMQRFFDEVFGE